MAIGLDPLRDTRDVPLEQYRAGLGDYLGTVMSDAWSQGPTMALGRLVSTATADAEAERQGEQLVPAEQASEEGREIGLRFAEPISRGALDVLVQQKQSERAAESTYQRARADNGYGTTAWLLGGGAEFLAGLADPLNVASTFVPVVGEARYALWAARIGRVPAMLARGAIEGAAGNALLEPVIAADRRQLDPDYSMLDSLVNVAFGAGLGLATHGIGAGLHWLGARWVPRENARRAPEGVVSDLGASDLRREASDPRKEPQATAAAMETLRPETREATLRTAIAQLGQDKPVDVEPVLAGDPKWPQVRDSLAAQSPVSPMMRGDLQHFTGPLFDRLGDPDAAVRSLDARVAQVDDTAAPRVLDRLDGDLVRVQREALETLKNRTELSPALSGDLDAFAPMAGGVRTEGAPFTEADWRELHGELERTLGGEGQDRRGALAADAGGGAPEPRRAEPGDRPQDRPAPEAPGLRRAGGEEPGGEGAPVETSALGDFAERQQSADLHADQPALAARDDRLAAEAADITAALADDMTRFGNLLEADDHATLKAFDAMYGEETKGLQALAACQLGRKA